MPEKIVVQSNSENQRVENETRPVSFWERANTQLSQKDKLLFTKYLSVLLKSGMAIDDAVVVLLAQAKGSMKKILTNLSENVKRGETLANGLSRYPHIFGSVFINLIRAGEESGTLRENLEHLAEQMQKERDLQQKIRGALMYPSVVVFAAVVISLGIVIFVLPNITGIFSTLKIELPLSTRILLWVADLFVHQGKWIGIGFVLAVISIIFLRKIEFIRPVTHGVLLRVPIMGGIDRKINLARFSRVLGTLLKSGMSIEISLDVTKSVLKNVYYERLVEKIRKEITQGSSISSVLDQHKFIIPIITNHMINVGEQTGTLADMLEYLAGFYEQEVDEAAKNLALTLEPILLIIIGVLVGGIVLSILTPIYQVVGQF